MFLVTLQGSGSNKSIPLWPISFISLKAVRKLFMCKWPFLIGSNICVCYRINAWKSLWRSLWLAWTLCILFWRPALEWKAVFPWEINPPESRRVLVHSKVAKGAECDSWHRAPTGRQEQGWGACRHLLIQPGSDSTTKFDYGLEFSDNVTSHSPTSPTRLCRAGNGCTISDRRALWLALSLFERWIFAEQSHSLINAYRNGRTWRTDELLHTGFCLNENDPEEGKDGD